MATGEGRDNFWKSVITGRLLLVDDPSVFLSVWLFAHLNIRLDGVWKYVFSILDPLKITELIVWTCDQILNC